MPLLPYTSRWRPSQVTGPLRSQSSIFPLATRVSRDERDDRFAGEDVARA